MLLGDLALDDPPIVTREDEDEPPVTWNARISEFCWQMALHQRAMSDEESLVFARDPRAELERRYPRLPLPSWRWGGTDLVLFGDDETVIALETTTPSAWLFGATEAAAARARALLAPFVEASPA